MSDRGNESLTEVRTEMTAEAATDGRGDVSARIAETLGRPIEVAGLRLRNRFSMAPMTRMRSLGGVPGSDVAKYYGKRGEDVGLIITEGVLIDHPMAGFYDNVPRLQTEEARAGWSAVIESVHAAGAKIVPQLWHVGPSTGVEMGDRSFLTPSGLDLAGERVPGATAATSADIDEVIASFVRGASAAKALGFDGVSLHGAHGYLLDSFIWSRTNVRTDGYGGALADRVRLASEVVAAVRSEVGDAFPIVYRFSQWKVDHYDAQSVTTPAELQVVVEALSSAGVDVFDVSTRRIWEPAFSGSSRTLAGWTRAISGAPVIAVGSVGVTSPVEGDDQDLRGLDLEHILDLYERGEFDVLAVGRALLSDPGWVGKVLDGRTAEVRAYQKHDEAHLW